MESNGAERPSSRPDARAAVEIGGGALLSALFFGLFLAIPLAGAIGLPLAGIPPVRIAHRRGIVPALLSAALAGGLLAAAGMAASDVAAISRGAIAAATAGLPAVFATLGRRMADPSRAYLALCAAGAAGIALLFLAGALLTGRSVADDISREFDRMIPTALASYKRSGMDADAVTRVRATLEAAREFSRRYWPGLLGLLWVFSAGISFYGGARAGRPAPSAEAARFERLRVPAAVAPLFVAAGAGSALLGEPARPVAGSILLPLAALYFVAGLSIICHFAKRWFRVGLLRVGIYTLVAYFPMNVGVALLGLFDWYVDFRRRGAGASEGP